jgi:hypothetical protein
MLQVSPRIWKKLSSCGLRVGLVGSRPMRRALGLALVFLATACLHAQAEVQEPPTPHVESWAPPHVEPPPSPTPSPVESKRTSRAAQRQKPPHTVGASSRSALVSDHSVSPVLACIRQIESTNNYRAQNGDQWGAYQFIPSTWRSVGGIGNPAHAPPEEQDMRAEMLLRREGLGPWPTPSRDCRHLWR